MRSIKLVTLAVSAAFASALAAAPTYTIKVACVDSANHPTMVTLDKVFKKKIETESKGTIKVELYPNGQLGGDRETCEAVQLNTIQMAIPANAALAGFDKRIQILDLPYLFTSREKAFQAVDGKLGKLLNGYLAKKGLLVLGYIENGQRHLSNRKQPVYGPEQMKGMKLRTMENKLHMEYFKKLGANPTPIAYGELYTALQQKTVDAMEAPYALYQDGKFYEVQKYITETGHVFSYEMLVFSKKFMQKLPKNLQKVVLDAAKATVKTQRAAMVSLEKEAVKDLQSKGVKINTLTDAQKKPFVEASQKTAEQFKDVFGKEVMAIVKKL